LRGLPRWPMERRSRAVALGASLLLLIGVVSVIVAGATATHPARPPQVGGGADSDPGYAEQPGRPAPVVEMSRDRSPAAVTAPANPGQSAATVGSVLTAAYHTESSRLGGYRGSVTIINPSRDTVSGWTVVMTLAPLSLAGEAAGVQRTQHGQIVTFTPTTDTRLITPGGNVVFTFEVDGVGSPSGCTIDGKACSGIPE
jgi:cellulose binding protein with CBM2 domain